METVVSKRRKGTQILYHDFLNRLIYPKLGDVKVAQIKFSDIAILILWIAQYADHSKALPAFFSLLIPLRKLCSAKP